MIYLVDANVLSEPTKRLPDKLRRNWFLIDYSECPRFLSRPELSLPSHAQVREADLIVNARVAVDPIQLEKEVRRTVDKVCQDRQGQAEFRQSQSVRPGRPTPTHRYAEAK